jgi:alpha 1,6-mannosyltransferase
MSRLSNHNLSSSRGDPSLGIHNPAISLVLSVEYDTTHPRQDPRPGYTRDLQIVQWTFLSKPYHPIFLDVLETATRGILEKRKAGGLDAWYDVVSPLLRLQAALMCSST